MTKKPSVNVNAANLKEPKQVKNPHAVALGKLSKGKSKNYTPEEIQRRQEWARGLAKIRKTKINVANQDVSSTVTAKPIGINPQTA